MSAGRDVATLTLGDAEAHLGETFTVSLAQGGMSLTLAEAEASGEASGQPARAGGAFSLLFTGPPGDHLTQGMHTLEHPVLGRLDLFLVPLGPDARGHRYQAVFT